MKFSKRRAIARQPSGYLSLVAMNRVGLSVLVMVAWLLSVGGLYGQAHGADEEMQALTEALKAYDRIDTGLVNRLNELGYRYWIIDPQQSTNYGDRALRLADSLAYPAGRARALRVIGVANWAQGLNELAFRYLTDALDAYTETGDSLNRANTLLNLGMVYTDQGEYDLATRNYETALSTFKRLGADSRVATTYTKMADLLLQRQRYEQAFTYLQRALRIHEAQDFQYGIGEVNVKLGQLNLEQGAYDSAIAHYLLGIRLGAQRFDHVGIGQCFYGIGLAYLRTDRPEEAKSYLDRAERMGNSVGLLKLLTDVYAAQGELAERERRWRDAYRYANKLQVATDSLHSRQLSVLIANQEARDELNARDAALQQAAQAVDLLEQQRRSDRLWRWVLLLALLLGTVIAFGLIRLKDQLLSSKGRDLQDSEKQVEKLREEVHDRDRELTAGALQLAAKSEAVTDLRKSLVALQKRVPSDVRSDLRRLTRQVDQLGRQDAEWEDFRTHFEAAHPPPYRAATTRLPRLDAERISAGRVAPPQP